MSDIQEAKNKCFHYANEHGSEALIAYLWLRIEALEAKLIETKRIADNASISGVNLMICTDQDESTSA